MVAPTQTRATIDDLYRVDGKAELIGGRIVHYMPAGLQHNRVAGRIYRSLFDHAETIGEGEAFTDNLGYALPQELTSTRESFSPDASYHAGPFPADERKFISGGPTFAAEVRSPDEYGPVADSKIADKRYDYFEAGTKAVWDVDPKSKTVALYLIDEPDTPKVFHLGEQAHAEPAVPGWQIPVDDLFK